MIDRGEAGDRIRKRADVLGKGRGTLICPYHRLSGVTGRRGAGELAHAMQRARGVWEPGSPSWLVDRRRVGPVIRALERETDPLFRQAGMSMD